MFERGVIHGRFQVVHNDHLTYLLAGKSRCRHLFVGITNPDPSHTAVDPADPNRSTSAANPLTYLERHILLRKVLLDEGVDQEEFTIVPFPINFPNLYAHYVPMDAVFFLTIYDDWGRRKMAEFRRLGLRVNILWERTLEEKGITGTRVRELMASGGGWKHLVPKAAAALLQSWGIPDRLRSGVGAPA